ncbi:hypothetical protein ACRALDRAFT_2092695, partial [Sodiomyces alcalophilus JCM 7366]|uniref:uncharacterized protein n=1 Tax=Sodiomyces alcalophilus JCM 7366 TaxID=591952 RepID=UPI0039B6B28F
KAAFITSTIFHGFMRPILMPIRSRSTPPSGRTLRQQKNRVLAVDCDNDTERTHWKEVGAEYCISIFTWAVAHSDETLLGQHWPMYTPFLLVLLDDPEIKYKAYGLAATRMFLDKCPDIVLRDQGVGGILSQAIEPTLALLPPLTPPDESARILDLAYTTMLQLAQIDSQPDSNASSRFLVKLLRDGVFAGYQQASKYPKVTEILLKHIATIVEELSLAASPYLEDILAIYSEILTDPFVARLPLCILAAVKALQVTLRNCWPCFLHGGHCDQVITDLSVCWLSVHDEEFHISQLHIHQVLLDEMISAAQLMSTILGISGHDLATRISRVQARCQVLDRLFPKERIA